MADSPMGETQQNAPRRRRLWPWFLGGFALVFVGLLLVYPVDAMHSSGQYAERLRLWAFYSKALPRMFRWSAVGPASINSSILDRVLMAHLALSLSGGCVATGIGWWRRRRQDKAKPDAKNGRG